jgi:hypothetical protein
MDTMDAKSVRFSQRSIAATFRDGSSADELAVRLRDGTIDPVSLPEIQLIERDGTLYSLDNRRLYAAQQAGVTVRHRMATAEEIRQERYKFTTINDGTSIETR